ncbi:heme uptake protein IsdC [Staphylococcus lugdunensis]|uniref:heme uptake protein IsdC n=1 Tax=Staphylococcus lugdunensis TaxID=28035 RepID=UPI003F495CCC|nr:heme uptake protein IsdC [Staphylococcus lugdunensis]
MKTVFKIVSFIFLCIFSFGILSSSSAFAEGQSLNYEVLKYNTNDTSIANDYFNKPATVVERNGKKYVQITVNHSHWITGMSIEGKNEKIINTNKAKDERTSEFEVSKTSGKVDGKISVYINEKVNGKPFKYDHHYNITYKFSGKDSGSSSAATPGINKSENGGTGSAASDAGDGTSSDSNSTSTDGSSVENPQTSAGTPAYVYLIPVVAVVFLMLSVAILKRNRKGNH